MKRTYLFDFDGTLVNSMPTFAKVMLKILNEEQIKYGEDIIKEITPLGYGGTADHFIKLGAKSNKKELTDRMHSYAIEEYSKNIDAKDSVIETLIKLKDAGHSLNILTASPHDMLDPCLKRLSIYSIFDNVWSSDDFSMKKSEPEIFVEAARRLGVSPSQIIFADDNIGALKSAKQAGAYTVGVYDESSDSAKDEIKSTADKYVFKLIEISEDL